MSPREDSATAGTGKNTEVKSPIPKQSNLSLAYISDRLSELVKIVSSVSMLVLFVMLCILIYQEAKKNYVIIEPFEVPKELENRGLTGRTAANLLYDKMNDIKSKARSKMQGQKFLPAWFSTQLETKMPGSDISVKEFQKLINRLAGKRPTYITGYIVFHDGMLRMTTRVSRTPAYTQEGAPGNLDGMLVKAAEDIFRHAEPYILAAYLSDTDKEASVNMIRYALSNEPAYDDPWAYNLWGNILSDRGEYEESVAKYRKAINKAELLHQQFAAPYNGIGQVLHLRGNYAEACANYQTACMLAPDMAEAYLNWGVSLDKMKRFDEAIAKYRKAIDLKSGLTAAYFSWGLALMNKGKFEEAIARFEETEDHSFRDRNKSLLAKTYCMWGRSLLELKRDRDAAQKFKLAAKLDPVFVNAFLKDMYGN